MSRLETVDDPAWRLDASSKPQKDRTSSFFSTSKRLVIDFGDSKIIQKSPQKGTDGNSSPSGKLT